MRLIDADSFMAFQAELPIKMGVRYAKTASFFFNKGCETVLEAIDAAPTIDPESLRPTATIWHDAQTDPPTENGEYQCYYEYYRYGNYNCMYRTMDRGQFFNGQWSGEPTHGTSAKVLAWAELPNPPEVDTDV